MNFRQFKKKTIFLIDEKIVKQNDLMNSKFFFSKKLITRIVALSDNKLMNIINEILNCKSDFNQCHTKITLYHKFKFEFIKFISMFKNFSSTKKIDIKSMNLCCE